MKTDQATEHHQAATAVEGPVHRTVGLLAPKRAEPVACETMLPDTARDVLVWRDGAAFGMARGHWQISKCRLTSSGPRWQCDEPGHFPMPTWLMRHVTHWMELPERPNAELSGPGRR